jgi:hypothetical protein
LTNRSQRLTVNLVTHLPAANSTAPANSGKPDKPRPQTRIPFVRSRHGPLGEEVPHMSSVYRKTISDERLKAVTDHVHALSGALPKVPCLGGFINSSCKMQYFLTRSP